MVLWSDLTVPPATPPAQGSTGIFVAATWPRRCGKRRRWLPASWSARCARASEGGLNYGVVVPAGGATTLAWLTTLGFVVRGGADVRGWRRRRAVACGRVSAVLYCRRPRWRGRLRERGRPPGGGCCAHCPRGRGGRVRGGLHRALPICAARARALG